jgi:hypothetical protein
MNRWQLLLISLTLALQAPGAVIDTFASGDHSLSWPPARGSVAVTSEVPISNSLFDTRYLSFRNGGVQSLAVTTSEQILAYDLGSEGGGYFRFGYRSSTPVDLLGGGASILRFHFEGATGGTRFPANLEFVTASGLARYSWGFLLTGVFNGNDGPFVVDVPLSAISGGDLTQVTEMTFDALRIAAGGSFRLSRVETIPEPSPIGLTLLVAVPLLMRRSRHANWAFR